MLPQSLTNLLPNQMNRKKLLRTVSLINLTVLDLSILVKNPGAAKNDATANNETYGT